MTKDLDYIEKMEQKFVDSCLVYNTRNSTRRIFIEEAAYKIVKDYQIVLDKSLNRAR